MRAQTRAEEIALCLRVGSFASYNLPKFRHARGVGERAAFKARRPRGRVQLTALRKRQRGPAPPPRAVSWPLARHAVVCPARSAPRDVAGAFVSSAAEPTNSMQSSTSSLTRLL